MTRLLAARCDGFVVAARVELSTEALALLEDRAIVAGMAGAAELDLGAAGSWQLRTAGSRLRLSNGDASCTIDPDAPPPPRRPPAGRTLEAAGDWTGAEDLPTAELTGWSLEVRFRATWLAVHELGEIEPFLRRIIAALGVSHEERVRRVDVCADFEFWQILPEDADAWVKHPRARVTSYRPYGAECEPDDEKDEKPTHRGRSSARADDAPSRAVDYRARRRVVSGLAIGLGGDLQLRCYDKTLELQLARSAHKAELEHAIWSRAHWGGGPVTRIEFQVRGEAIRELGLRDLREALRPGGLDGLWAYCAGMPVARPGDTPMGWARLVIPGTSERWSRSTLDPRWRAVQAVIFSHRAQPLARRRVRGAADFATAWGSMLSFLGAEGSHAHAANYTRELTRLHGLDERTLSRALGERREAHAGAILDALLAGWRAQALKAGTTETGFAKLIALVLATDARFSTQDERKPI